MNFMHAKGRTERCIVGNKKKKELYYLLFREKNPWQGETHSIDFLYSSVCACEAVCACTACVCTCCYLCMFV